MTRKEKPHSRRMRSFELRDAETLNDYLKKSKRIIRPMEESTYPRKSEMSVSQSGTATVKKPGHYRAKTSIRFYKA
jgi:hypothetical protein